MAVVNTKSANITNRDAAAQIQNNTGQGAPGRIKEVDDFISTTSGDSAASTYRMVQVPSNARVKKVELEAEAMTAGAFDIGAYYAVGRQDQPAAGVISQAFWASAVSAAAAVTPTDVTNESGTNTLDKRGKQLWDALGLTADPGGYFDVVFTCTTGVTVGARMGVKVFYEGD